MQELLEICKEIEEKYLKEDIGKEKDVEYFRLGKKLLYDFGLNEKTVTVKELKTVTGLIRKVSRKEKNTSKILEKDILSSVTYYTEKHVETLLSNKLKTNQGIEDSIKNIKIGEEKYLKKSLELEKLAYDLLKIKKDRDSFSGERQGYATRILTELSKVFKIENIEEIYLKNLKTRGQKLLIETLDCIQEYYKEEKGKDEKKDEIINIIDKRANKSKKRSELVSCLQALIELNHIGELDALDRVGKWKEKYYYN